MSYETAIDEPVKVWALFDPSTHSTNSVQASSGQAMIFPIAMNWQRRFIKFDKLILKTSKRVGQIKILTLICGSDTANYELEYNCESNLWRVTKVMPSI